MNKDQLRWAKLVYLWAGFTFACALFAVVNLVLADAPLPPVTKPEYTREPAPRRPTDATSTPMPIRSSTSTTTTQMCWYWYTAPCTPPPTPAPPPEPVFDLSGKGLAGPTAGASDVTRICENNGDKPCWRYNWNPLCGAGDVFADVIDVPQVRDLVQQDRIVSGDCVVGGDSHALLLWNEPDLCPHQGCVPLGITATTRMREIVLWNESLPDPFYLVSPAPSPNHWLYTIDLWWAYEQEYGEFPPWDALAIHPYIWEVEVASVNRINGKLPPSIQYNTGKGYTVTLEKTRLNETSEVYNNIREMANMVETNHYWCRSMKQVGRCRFGLVATESAGAAPRHWPTGTYDYARAISAYDRFLSYPLVIHTADGDVDVVVADLLEGIAWYTARDDKYWGFCDGYTTGLYGRPCSGDPPSADDPDTSYAVYFRGLEVGP